MRYTIRAVWSAFIVLSVAASFGQTQNPYERVLLPIIDDRSAQPLPGAHGSLWKPELAGRNNAAVSVEIIQQPQPGICSSVPCQPPAEPQAAVRSLLIYSPDPNGGAFVYIGNPGRDGKVTLSLRIRDLSRQSQTWGTTIPVVREKDVFTGTLTLLDVPTDSRFRSALRVYDFDFPEDRQVTLRIYASNSNTPLVTTELELIPAVRPGGHPEFPDLRNAPVPGRAFIADLVSRFPQLNGVGNLRLEIEPKTAGLRFWAFSSVTNNETQHVTTVIPD